MKLRVDEIIIDSPLVRIYVLKHPLKPLLNLPSAGAHVDVRLPDGKIRQYSLCGDPDDASQYRIAVKLESDGRGGSRWMHESVQVGTELHVSTPRNNFPLADQASRHIFIAGGIGITPFLPMAISAQRRGEDFVLHYCARESEKAPLRNELRQNIPTDKLHTWFADTLPAQRFDPSLIGPLAPGKHVYCCGPQKLIDAVREATLHWPEEQVHFEVFAPYSDSDFKPEPFDIVLASSGKRLHVPADRSALDVLRDGGLIMPSSCELGVCGSCECGYRSGEVQHRDVVLSASKRQHRMLPCVSRARTQVVLEL